MKNKRIFIPIILLIITLFISACTPTSAPEVPANPPGDSSGKDIEKLEQEMKEKDEKIEALESNIGELEAKVKELELEQEPEPEEDPEPENEYGQDNHILVNSVNVLTALKEEDMETLKSYMHPEKGVRFTAYEYIDVENDVVLNKDEIVEAFNDSETYTWGNYDGTGDPIELNLNDYYKEFVYDEDFLNPHIIRINNTVSMGNSINNVEEIYTDGQYIEFYFEGFDDQYAGMDWRNLKLVFEEYEGRQYLVGIIHGQWTI